MFAFCNCGITSGPQAMVFTQRLVPLKRFILGHTMKMLILLEILPGAVGFNFILPFSIIQAKNVDQITIGTFYEQC